MAWRQRVGRADAPPLRPVLRSGAVSLSFLLAATGDRVEQLLLERPSALLPGQLLQQLQERRRVQASAGITQTAARPLVSGTYAQSDANEDEDSVIAGRSSALLLFDCLKFPVGRYCCCKDR